MNTVFRLVNPVYDMDMYIFKVNVFTKQAKDEYNFVFCSWFPRIQRAGPPPPRGVYARSFTAPMFTDGSFTKSTRAYTQKELIRGGGLGERARVRRHCALQLLLKT